MKKVTVFVITGCPYCAQARKALKELVSENPEYAKVEFEEINELPVHVYRERKDL